jgi:cold shock CspA family protein
MLLASRVIWFNNLKGFGEAKASDGREFYIHYSAVKHTKDKVILQRDQEIFCIVDSNHEGKLVADSILLQLPIDISSSVGLPKAMPNPEA